ncbi:Uncharacterized protein HZ326_10895 [Fusarium oxysporum f. sp. albedinis]|nr:Uncharacterized protein HZ326_10895 [Fusarium oxysporum f. sp. albedinis]
MFLIIAGPIIWYELMFTFLGIAARNGSPRNQRPLGVAALAALQRLYSQSRLTRRLPRQSKHSEDLSQIQTSRKTNV